MNQVAQDVPRYMMVAGDRAELRGLNIEGLRRNGFSDQEVGFHTILKFGVLIDKMRLFTVLSFVWQLNQFLGGYVQCPRCYIHWSW